MASGSTRINSENDGLPALYNREGRDHDQATGTTKKTYSFAILAIVGLSGLVVGIIGLAQVLQAGSLTNQAIIMMATGGGGTLFLIIGAIGLFKNHQISNLSNNIQTESTESNESVIENNRTVAPLKRTEVPGVKNFTVFGAREWEHYYGDVGAEPAYPEGIADILNAQCPFSEHENTKVKDTHMLVLVPATVRGKALNLNRLEELIKHPKNSGHPTKYNEYNFNAREVHGTTSSSQSYWVLMTKDVILGSTDKTDVVEQQELVTEKGGGNYTLPGALEVAICIFMEHVLNGNKLFGMNPLTYTRCSETVQEKSHVVVGGFTEDGLYVIQDKSYFDTKEVRGVVALRKFLI